MVKVSILGSTGIIGKNVAFTLARADTVDEIVLSNSVKNIPEGFVSNGCYKSISGPGFFINAEFSQFNNSL